MQAKKLGIENIDVYGKKIEAVKVYYAATGLAESYYHRHYYFRVSDGMFVKKEDPKGRGGTTLLLSEKTQE